MRYRTEIACCTAYLATKPDLTCASFTRSLLAAEVLYNAGYRNLAWLENGFRFVEQKDLPDLVGDTKIKYASAGGLAAILLKTVDSFQSSQEATS
jgi:hypothetical protein